MPPDILNDRRRIWATKSILRKLYSRWYGFILEALAPGRTLELGGGSGNIKEFLNDSISTDIVFEPWLDAVLDAHELPFKIESIDNIVLFDVLHHLSRPERFFLEATRLLKPKGRIVLMEPYISPCSFLIYKFLHAEGMNYLVHPFNIRTPRQNKNPFHGNQAIPTLIFEKYVEKFTGKFPRLKIVRKEIMDSLIYPLSGGFHNPSILPLKFLKYFEWIEKLLRPLNRFLAFRIFVVLEKQ